MSVITKSIGTSSRDYSTITLWEAALGGAAGGAGNDSVGECYDDSAFDESVTVDDATPNTIKLTVPTAERHDGTAGTGVRNVCSTIRLMAWSSSKRFDAEWIEWDQNGQRPESFVGIIDMFSADVAGHVRNCIVHTAVTTSIAGAGGGGIRLRVGDFSANSQTIVDCIVYDIGCVRALDFDVFGISASFGSRNRSVCNNTAHNIYKDNAASKATCFVFGDQANDKYQNNLATDPGGTTSGTKACYEPTSFSSATADHNAASDTTASGTGSLDSITTADQYVSTTVGSEDLHLKSGADCIDAGTDLATTPSGVNIDIDGRDRDAQGDTWDIGADEFVATGVSPPEAPYVLRGGGIAEIAWPAWQQSFRF